MTTEPTKCALFLGPTDQQHHVTLFKRARSLGAEVVACYQAHFVRDLGLAGDQLTVGAANGKFGLVIVPSAGSLDRDPLDALTLVGRLLELGLQIVSLSTEDSWLPASPELINSMAGWLRARFAERKSEKIRQSLRQAHAEGRCGRPKKVIPQEAIAAVEGGERLAQVARRYLLGQTTLRRAVALHRAQLESESRRTAA